MHCVRREKASFILLFAGKQIRLDLMQFDLASLGVTQ